MILFRILQELFVLYRLRFQKWRLITTLRLRRVMVRIALNRVLAKIARRRVARRRHAKERPV